MLQTSVEIVNPGGTGRPALVISARPEPLPPSRSFMCRLPSALPPPKKYTCFRDLAFVARDCCSLPASSPFDHRLRRSSRCDRPDRLLVAALRPDLLVGDDLGRCRRCCRIVPREARQQREPRAPHRRIVGHHQHVGEEAIDRRAQRAELAHRVAVICRRGPPRRSPASARPISAQQRQLRRLGQRDARDSVRVRAPVVEAPS